MRNLSIMLFSLLAILLASIAFSENAKFTYKGKLNINTATVSELQKLPNVGAKKAVNIVNFRAKSPFNSIEEIMKVKGLSKKIYPKIRDYIKVDGLSDFELVKLSNNVEKKN